MKVGEIYWTRLVSRGGREQAGRRPSIILQKDTRLGNFDRKTSSWVKTPAEIRNLGGALFCDRRYGNVFVYHNGASSYYSARAFRGSLKA